MLRYLIRRIIRMLLVLFGVVTLVFFIFRLMPGDPARLLAGLGATEDAVNAIREQLGLNRPAFVQYLDYMKDLASLDLGRSRFFGGDVLSVMVSHLPPTLALTFSALGLSLLIGVPVGVLSAVRPYSVLDRTATFASVALLSVPNFWLGLILISVFAVKMQLLPAGGYGGLQYLVLPTVAVSGRLIALIARTTRSAMLEVVRRDYVRTARAKGLSERVVVYKHAFRNALIPVVTLAGIQLGYLLGGSVVIETLFSYQGIGFLLINAVSMRDYGMVQALTILYVTTFLLINLIVDVAYAVIDPRIQYS